MSSRRTLILVGAIVIGVIAALLIYNYVQGIDDRANNNAKLVDVYVAKLRGKLRRPNETEPLFQSVRGVGYKFA